MITFDLDTLRAVAKAATRDVDYWRELFDPDSGYFTVRLGVVAVVINAAIEAGVVVLPGTYTTGSPQGAAVLDYIAANPPFAGSNGEKDDDDDDIDPAAPRGLPPDYDGGFSGTGPKGLPVQTPAGHTIHVNGDPEMSEETAQAIRELADKVHEMMGKKMEAAAENTLRQAAET